MQRFLRPFSFSLMGAIILLLIAGSVVEQIYGTVPATHYVYAAPWTIALWAMAAISGIVYLCTTPMPREQFITFLLHFSFVVILAGAMITHVWGKQGDIHLRVGEPAPLQLSTTRSLTVTLTDFRIDYYPGSMAPADFVSEIEVAAEGCAAEKGVVSMNNIFSYHHHRFYQSQYDSDGEGVTLRYSYDPWGIGVTYTGYVLLLLSMIGFFFQQRTRFRALLKQLAMAVLLLLPALANATNSRSAVPPTVPHSVAEEWGRMYVYYNDRVCPMRTLAVDFTTKLCGKPSYRGLSAEQVLCGWLFYYDQWAAEPCIKIKGKDARAILGIEGKYARLNDYVGDKQYKLADAIRQGNRNARAADEKFQLISMVCTGRMMKIYPLAVPSVSPSANSHYTWYSWSDRLPKEIPFEDWQFCVRSMDYVALCVAEHAWPEAQDALTKIKAWQKERVGGLLSDFRFEAERYYKAFHYTRPLAMACATIGLLLFILSCVLVSRGKALPRWAYIACVVVLAVVLIILTLAIALRWIASGHVPLANGFETMQFMAWVSALLTLTAILRAAGSNTSSPLLMASGFLVTGMTLMVSMMSASNPQITHLMPVLQSPLLTMHVAVIMIAYCLLAFIMLNGVAALCVPSIRLRMQTLSQVLLYPAVFCLTIGIFLGAVWANISWGRYWGWDPKEVWALITMLVYAGLLHWRNPKGVAFHICCVVAFLFVLFTYFGVNFVLGGLHSYATA